MPTSGRLVTLDTKSGETESSGGDVGGDDREPLDAVREREASIWDNVENQRDVHGDVLVPFFISPSARTAMRTLSSWSSSEFELDDAEDDEGDGLGIVADKDCREEEARVHTISLFTCLIESSMGLTIKGNPLTKENIQSEKEIPS